MVELTREQWNTLQDALAAPFPPESISWRVQGKAAPNSQAQVLAYIDARDVQDRLDAVVGAGNWSFDWQPIVTDAKGLLVAKGTITIYGVSKSDIGDASNFEGNKGCISDTFKRAAVHWGIGRFLYGLDAFWVTLDSRGQIDAKARASLQAKLLGKKLEQETPAALKKVPTVPEQCKALADDLGYSDESRADLKQQYTANGKVDWEGMKQQLLKEAQQKGAKAS